MTTITDSKSQVDPYYKEGVIRAIILNDEWPSDAFIDFKPEDRELVPPNAYWKYENQYTVVLEKSSISFDPDRPKATGFIRFEPEKPQSRIPIKIQKANQDPVPKTTWKELPEGFYYVTAEAIFWDMNQASEDLSPEYNMTDKQWIEKLTSGNLSTAFKHISPREFGLEMGMASYQEVITKNRTNDIAKTLKSLHLWALAIMVIGLLMLILLSAGSNS